MSGPVLWHTQGSRVTKLPKEGTINMATMSSPRTSGYIGMDSQALRKSSIEDTHRELIEKAQAAGLTPEIKDMIDSFDEARRILTKKNFELNILETLAMESTDENVSDLREQLFTTVKIVHQDLVSQIMIREYRDEGLESSIHGSRIDMGDDKDGRLTQKVRTWFYKRQEMREKLKQYKKNLKIKMDIENH